MEENQLVDTELIDQWTMELDNGREETDKLTEHLLDLSDKLDQKEKRKSADAVDGLIKSASLTKLAQYVGVIGYVLKQNRAMGNCIRKKRASSNIAMQDIVLSCLKEYQDGQQFNDTNWTSKYAQVIQDTPSAFDTVHLRMLAELGHSWDIKNHVDKVEKVAAMLETENAADPVIKQILSHIGSLGEILSKEASHVNFKVAAPKSKRSRWSRFWSPSQTSWNPLSWSGRARTRGDDQEAMLEMDAVLNSIREISSTSQQAKTTMLRLKNKAAAYKRLEQHSFNQKLLETIR